MPLALHPETPFRTHNPRKSLLESQQTISTIYGEFRGDASRTSFHDWRRTKHRPPFLGLRRVCRADNGITRLTPISIDHGKNAPLSYRNRPFDLKVRAEFLAAIGSLFLNLALYFHVVVVCRLFCVTCCFQKLHETCL